MEEAQAINFNLLSQLDTAFCKMEVVEYLEWNRMGTMSSSVESLSPDST